MACSGRQPGHHGASTPTDWNYHYNTCSSLLTIFLGDKLGEADGGISDCVWRKKFLCECLILKLGLISGSLRMVQVLFCVC